jgi:hypothetical protein
LPGEKAERLREHAEVVRIPHEAGRFRHEPRGGRRIHKTHLRRAVAQGVAPFPAFERFQDGGGGGERGFALVAPQGQKRGASELGVGGIERPGGGGGGILFEELGECSINDLT